MGGIALECRRLGHQVTGSDPTASPPMSTVLEEAGIPLWDLRESPALPPDTEIVIATATLDPTTPEIREARRRRLPIYSFPGFLEEYFMRGKRVLAVAGTKGKSSTTAALIHLFRQGGIPCSYLVGAIFNSGEPSVHFDPEADWWIIEADEYQTYYWDLRAKFAHYWPEALAITNLYDDHHNIYPEGYADVQGEYIRLVRALPDDGLLVIWDEEERARELAGHALAPVAAAGGVPTSEFRLREVEPAGDGTRFLLNDTPFEIRLPGEFNARNVVMACALAARAGLSLEDCAEFLRSFEGVEGRQTMNFDLGGVRAYNEHHRNWIGITHSLPAIRQMNPGRRHIVVFRPNACGRQDQDSQLYLGQALSQADVVILFPEVRQLIPVEEGGFDYQRLENELIEQGVEVHRCVEKDYPALLADLVRVGDVFAFFYCVSYNPLLEALRLYLVDPDQLRGFTLQTPVSLATPRV